MRILICDDNKYMVDDIKHIVENYFADNDMSVEINAQTDSCVCMQDNSVYDMAFLDIEMPQYSGLEVGTHLKKQNSDIILFIITSHQSFLDDALDLRVLRFLPKPIEKERVESGLDSALKMYVRNTSVMSVERGGVARVYTKDILYITICKRKTLVVTKHGEYNSDKTLDEWKLELDSRCFAQPHYSYIVNFQNVYKIEKGEVVLLKKEGEYVSVKITQRKLTAFKNQFFDYLSETI